MSHADFAPILLFVVVVGHRWLAGMATGAADARDRVGCLQMASLGILFQGAGSAVLELQNMNALPSWLYFILSGLGYVATAAAFVVDRAEIRLLSLLVGHVVVYVLVGGLLPTFTTAVTLACALVPSLLVTMTGWNKGAGFRYLGEIGAPIPRVVEGVVMSAGLSVLCGIVLFTYKIIT